MRIAIATLAQLLLSTSLLADPVQVAIAAPASTNVQVTLRLRSLQRTSDIDAKHDDLVVLAESASTQTIDLAPGTWALDAEAIGLWHARQYFSVVGGNTNVVATLVPAGMIRGKLIAPSAA